MFGEPACLKDLTARKQQLVLQAECQRAEIRNEIARLDGALRRMSGQARLFRSAFKLGSLILSSFWLSRDSRRQNGGSESGAGSKLWRGAKLAASAWIAVRSGFR
jgi:hypothetical protein